VSQKRVLVVEDEMLVRMLAVDMLLDLDISADEAGTAREALEHLRGDAANYALVFMDIGLPDLRGDELIREIRQTHPHLPLLVASGEDQVELKTRLGSFSPIAFLGKPYDTGQLGQALKTLGI
jgi:CheY-like chemotaxis protein